MTANAHAQLNAALSGRYTIERELGAGGMATVYLAQDVRHHRKVALKVLRPELSAILGADRFLAEIKTTANLQHPHILSLFDSGEADGLVFYVMPYVEGESLRDRLKREQQLPIDDALRIAREVLDALEYAHKHGIVHRDIKPENILLHGGHAMVADFGIALAASKVEGGTRMTETGMSLGTPHYMSPEQAMGERVITPRADIYALGCVLYEMLTGEPPFTGASAQAIVARVLTEEPRSLTVQRKTIPPHVADAVEMSLQKLPADRFPDARAFLDALANPGYVSATQTSQARRANPAATKSLRRALAGAIALALVFLIAAVAGWLRPKPPAPVRRLDLTLGPAIPTVASDVAISPDGSMLAYAGTMNAGTPPSIWLRRLDGDPEFRMLAGTEGGVQPAFSSDNQWIVFRKGTQGTAVLAKVSVNGGGVTTIFNGNTAYFPHWGMADRIVFSGPSGIFIIPAEGGTPVNVKGATAVRPFLLPDGSGVLEDRNGDVVVYDLATDSSKVLVRSGRQPVYSPSGHLLYVADDGGLFAVPFELRGHRVTGPPRRILDRVASGIPVRGFSLSDNGTLVWHEGATLGTGGASNRLVVIRFAGGADTLPLPKARRLWPRFSPNGRFLAFGQTTTRGSGDEDIYTYDMVTGTNTQLTFAANNIYPVWSPDGTRVLYTRDSTATGVAGRLHVHSADNSGAVHVLDSVGYRTLASDWPSEDLILVQAATAAGSTDSDLFSMVPKPGEKAQPYLKAPWDEREMVLSPDGKLAAFTARESGTNDVWLRDFPTPIGKWRVSPNGGLAPRWSRDGQYIYYWRSGAPVDTLFRARVDRTPQPVVRAPEVMIAIDALGISNWDLHPDGTRFVTVIADAPAAPAVSGPGGRQVDRHLVVLNWFTELNAAFGKRK
jgi:Tol biopolymer transport system component